MNGFGVSPIELMTTEAVLRGILRTDDFVYSAAFITGTTSAIGSLATNEVQVIINGDSDFVVQEQNITAFTTVAAVSTLVQAPNLLITITRAGSGREIMNQAQHVLNVCGGYSANGGPRRLAMPSLWNESQVISVKLQNLTTVVFDRIDVAFPGYKCFYQENADGSEVGTRRSVFNKL
jgi:hypothetical protein